MASDTFKAGDLTAVIGDNSKSGEHRAGYNGIWSLTHRSEERNLFVPTVAGLNFEHIFDGDKADTPDNSKVFFEPRHAPMTFKKLSDTEAELHQPPTPTFHLESWTRFRLTAPHYLDMSFRFRATQHVFAHGYIGLFWASYINAPLDKSMYFRGSGLWQQLCTQRHNDQSTVRHRDDKIELKFSPGYRDSLFRNLSSFRFEEPFFYGLFHKQIVVMMFDRTEGIRLTHSPSGGGMNKEAETTNPAWDFQYLVPKYEVKKEYGFRARLVYREACSRAEVRKEYEKWRKTDMEPEKKKRRQIEREFGVPIAGEILDPRQWTQTALKKLPDGLLDLEQLFGRAAPLVLDLGCGNGRFLLGSAVWRREHDHLGIDVLPVVIRYATRRGNQRGLSNLRFAVCDAERFLATHWPPGAAAEIHCYHPQPYYDPAEVHRRLFTPAFLVTLHAALVPGGLFFVQTDNPGYWRYLREVVPVFFDFEERRTPWPDAPKGRTRREIIALRRGLPVFRGSGTAKTNLSMEEALKLAESLPPPTFDADRRLRALDEEERESPHR